MSYGNNAVVSFDDRTNLVLSNESLFIESATCDSIKWNKEKQFAIQLLQNNDYLANVAMKQPSSMQNALVNVAAIGISLNPALKHAYLVPRNINKKQQVCLDISYMGLLHIAQDSGAIAWGQSKLVYSNDTYINKGIDKEPSHEYQSFGDRGNLIGVYCVVKTSTGDFLTEEMSIEECFKIRGRSEAFKKGHGPWKTDEGEMIRKTVVKRAHKYWPKCVRLAEAVEALNNNGEGIAFDEEPQAPVITPEEYQAAQDELIQGANDQLSTSMNTMNCCETIKDLEVEFVNIWRFLKTNELFKNMIVNAVTCKDLNKKRLEA